MRIKDEYRDGVLRVWLSGELDHHAAGEGVERIGEKVDVYLPRECELDMEGLGFMDSSGIALVVRIKRRMEEIGGRMKVKGAGKSVMKVLRLGGVERIVEIEERGSVEK